MVLPVILIGGGGHARVLCDALRLRQRQIRGYTDLVDRGLASVPYLGDDGVLTSLPVGGVELVNAIGSVGDMGARRAVFERLGLMGFRFAGVVHPSAVVATGCDLAEGVQVMAGAVLQPGCRIGADSIVNTRATIDHDCIVGAHVHVAPGATICGDVHVGDGCHVGAGAVVIQGVRIGPNAIVGAGAVVTRDVEASTTVVGVPARAAARTRC